MYLGQIGSAFTDVTGGTLYVIFNAVHLFGLALPREQMHEYRMVREETYTSTEWCVQQHVRVQSDH